MAQGDGPKRAYAELILLYRSGAGITEAQVDLLPEPEAFRDAVFLAANGTFSPTDLDECDALILALIRSLKAPRRSR